MAVQSSTWSRMDVKALLFAGVGMLLFSCGGEHNHEKIEPVNQEPLTLDEARNIFILHCESCHGIDGKKKSAEAADLSVSKLSDEQVRQMVLTGNDKGMMPYKEIITSKRDLDGLVEFVKSLRVENDTNE